MAAASWSDGDLAEIVACAVLAPSSHNTQPWRFRRRIGGIELLADRGRALPRNDPDDRELTISCGCALLNLRLAALRRGRSPEVERLPDPEAPHLLARVSAGAPARLDAETARLLDVLRTRRTQRSPFADRSVAADLVRHLEAAAATEGARLVPVEDDEARRAVAGLVVEGDSVQWADPRWRAELASWMRPEGADDGLAVPRLMAPVIRAVVRHADLGRRVGVQDRSLAEAAPVLAVLATRGDGPADWLTAGQALQRLLLTARCDGLQAGYLNQPVQVQTLRPRLRQALDLQDHPQVLLRLGYPRAVEGPPRRRDAATVLAPP